MADSEEGLTLSQLQVVYDRRGDRPGSFGRRNAYGLWVWPGAEHTVVSFTLKAGFVVPFGRLRLRALRVRGIRSPEHRAELVFGAPPSEGAEAEVSLRVYIVRLIKLFFVGVAFGNPGDPPIALLDQSRLDHEEVAGTFRLVPIESQ